MYTGTTSIRSSAWRHNHLVNETVMSAPSMLLPASTVRYGTTKDISMLILLKYMVHLNHNSIHLRLCTLARCSRHCRCPLVPSPAAGILAPSVKRLALLLSSFLAKQQGLILGRLDSPSPKHLYGDVAVLDAAAVINPPLRCMFALRSTSSGQSLSILSDWLQVLVSVVYPHWEVVPISLSQRHPFMWYIRMWK